MRTPAAPVHPAPLGSFPFPPRTRRLGMTLRTATFACVAVAAFAVGAAACAEEADDQYALAAGLYARQEWKLADEAFRDYLQKHSAHSKRKLALFYHAETLLQLGQYEAAQTRLREYLREDPSGEFATSALYRAGEAAWLAGKLDEAKTSLKEFLEKHPEDSL